MLRRPDDRVMPGAPYNNPSYLFIFSKRSFLNEIAKGEFHTNGRLFAGVINRGLTANK